METEKRTSEFPNGAKDTIEQILGGKIGINSKEQDCENHTQ